VSGCLEVISGDMCTQTQVDILDHCNWVDRNILTGSFL